MLISHNMRNKTPELASFHRALRMLNAVLEDAGKHSVSALARQHDIPVATAHRQVATLVSAGWLKPVGRGRHVPGVQLAQLVAAYDEKRVLANNAGPLLERLARRVKSVVQLGTFEHDMVTYRIKAGRAAGTLFTQVGTQLEAYCSAMGKVLLADLPPSALDAYLADAPFPALTANTITDPAQLRLTMSIVREQGFALDNEEAIQGLCCVAVPIRNHLGKVVAAISVSRPVPHSDAVTASDSPDPTVLALLRETSAALEKSVFGDGLDADAPPMTMAASS